MPTPQPPRITRAQLRKLLDQPWPRLAGQQSRALRATLTQTLRLLARQMSADGELEVPRDELADKIGVPRRTLDRHLTHLVESGWLVHLALGQKNVRGGRYAAADPRLSTRDSRQMIARSQRATDGALSAPESDSQCATHSCAENPLSAPPVACISTYLREDDHAGRSPSRTRQGVPDPTDDHASRVVRPPCRGPAAKPISDDIQIPPGDPSQSTGPRNIRPRAPPGARKPGRAATTTTLIVPVTGAHR